MMRHATKNHLTVTRHARVLATTDAAETRAGAGHTQTAALTRAAAPPSRGLVPFASSGLRTELTF